jgi:hypothetical protein
MSPVEISPAIIIILILAAFVLSIVLKRYEHTLPYVISCAVAFVWFLAVTIMKAGAVAIHITILSGIVALFALWRTITLAMRLKRANNEKPLP